MGGETTGLAYAPGAVCANDATNSTERTSKSVNSRFLDTGECLFFTAFCLLLSSLEEDGGTAIECRKMCRINLGHLEDGNSHTDDHECQDNGDYLTGGGFETLEEDLKDEITVADIGNMTKTYDCGDHGAEGDCST
jgi:hypothetical protein